jgi:7,8-dihydropterin-6-yl-methyl-4-(beta-D-ribofuranosyl)aminobenzene 5'-phosphate synthase
MRITALIENQSNCDLKPIHGLSLYIETEKHKILFDLGPNDTLFENAKKKGVNLENVDIVIISHGHMDHGGALEHFLKINTAAKVFVQRKAFEPHYSRFLCFNFNVGLKEELKNNKQIIMLDGDYLIDNELQLFVVPQTKKCYSNANNALYTKDGKDDFMHEQNLLIREKKNVLVMGCGHAGVVNILERARDSKLEYCVGGYHVFNPMTKRTVSEALLDEIADEMKKYKGIQFYTCHCTGKKAYNYLCNKMENMNYLSCGETIVIE